ncbi:Uncharacterised protein [Serratia quinivorans]|nr:Uncharacterised protein [Serratia quinivorans]
MTMGIQTTEDERHICIFVMRLKVTSRFDAVQWGGENARTWCTTSDA